MLKEQRVYIYAVQEHHVIIGPKLELQRFGWKKQGDVVATVPSSGGFAEV